jgi:hypothetical protein
MQHNGRGRMLTCKAPRKVLKPTEFQDFPLKEKTILSHNTAMYERPRCCSMRLNAARC